jgi:hypothetical protein
MHEKDIESLEASNKECKMLSGELDKLKIDLKTVEDKVNSMLVKLY